MSASLLPQHPDLLTSWKEIASYLGKGVRTVQRWEQDYGLPVRRPNHKDKGIVHATKQDLDHWLAEQWSWRERKPPRPNVFETDKIEAARVAIQQSAELRASNRQLLAQIKQSVEAMFAECQALASGMCRTPSNGVI